MEHTDSLYVMEKGKIIYQSETKDADKNDVQKLMTD
jgi:ABC-type sugar transport system ATPase subunit